MSNVMLLVFMVARLSGMTTIYHNDRNIELMDRKRKYHLYFNEFGEYETGDIFRDMGDYWKIEESLDDPYIMLDRITEGKIKVKC